MKSLWPNVNNAYAMSSVQGSQFINVMVDFIVDVDMIAIWLLFDDWLKVSEFCMLLNLCTVIRDSWMMKHMLEGAS